MATIAIGDVHGNYPALDDLLRKLTPEISAADVVVFLGDYIDRGLQSKACVDRILAFEREIAAAVVCLRGNHDNWMLETRRDYRRHTWLLATDAYPTILSYWPPAALALSDAVLHAGAAVYGDDHPLPYELFFDAVPEAHLRWFDALRLSHRSEDCFCSHGGVDPRVPELERQQPFALIWGMGGFPENYRGDETIVYGHRNNAVVDADGWPSPAFVGRTIGIDTISHGVLTAIRLPDRQVFQSARYR